jgi:hypothetical protein
VAFRPGPLLVLRQATSGREARATEMVQLSPACHRQIGTVEIESIWTGAQSDGLRDPKSQMRDLGRSMM